MSASSFNKATMYPANPGFKVTKSGLLSLVQDLGRYGCHNIGLTTGGPLDPYAFKWANRLLANELNASAIEISIGGLALEALVDTRICITGAEIEFTINGINQPQWQSLAVTAGDNINFGFVSSGVRSYLAVRDGFDIEPTFGSTSTVVREGLGGVNGTKLLDGQFLPCANFEGNDSHLKLATIPEYKTDICLRVILGYQHHAFTALQKRRFFSSVYRVSEHCDRMGYRLTGPEIKPAVDGILSEGICLGAIQVPANGQPIVLMNDRQTIGGYPKLGSVLSADLAKLAQCAQGATIRFEQISIEDAHNILHLDKVAFAAMNSVKIEAICLQPQ
ncbi:biotin-dependent carboxyltransferase family protein [Thalassotalea sp. ND16A]|uniref:5-oxoprolinase subunit C family protein n=1 Tax=Thalassotalea sp. ND16A TaxID=1535422 RepID=UPI00051D4730|nr:biotin-dependent carboxyltransferase family protein [Thalassotalea sp. ND16A]KGJ96044.1 Urea carboxylase [Thalassotalea sp. ND16A]